MEVTDAQKDLFRDVVKHMMTKYAALPEEVKTTTQANMLARAADPAL